MRGDAGRCGVACMRACPWAPCHAQRLPLWGKITSFSKRPSFFGKITQNLWARQRRARQQRRARHAAKAWHAAKAHGMQPRPRHAAPQGHGGMLPRPRQPPWHAAKAKAAPARTMQHAAKACSPPRHAAKAMARSQGHSMQPPKARCTQPRPCSSEGQGSSPPPPPWRPWHAAPQGSSPPWHAAKDKACGQGQGMLPRPRHAA